MATLELDSYIKNEKDRWARIIFQATGNMISELAAFVITEYILERIPLYPNINTDQHRQHWQYNVDTTNTNWNYKVHYNSRWNILSLITRGGIVSNHNIITSSSSSLLIKGLCSFNSNSDYLTIDLFSNGKRDKADIWGGFDINEGKHYGGRIFIVQNCHPSRLQINKQQANKDPYFSQHSSIVTIPQLGYGEIFHFMIEKNDNYIKLEFMMRNDQIHRIQQIYTFKSKREWSKIALYNREQPTCSLDIHSLQIFAVKSGYLHANQTEKQK
eukprot:244982_1